MDDTCPPPPPPPPRRIPRPFFALMVAAGGALLVIVWPHLLPLMTGGVLALLFRPVFLGLRRLFRGQSAIAASVTLVVVLLVFIVPSGFLGYLLIQEAQGVVGQVVEWAQSGDLWATAKDQGGQLAKVRTFLREHWPGGTANWTAAEKSAQDALVSMAKNLGATMAEVVGRILQGTASVLFFLMVTLFSMFFFLVDGQAFVNFLRRVSPLNDEINDRLFKDFDRTSHAIVYGTVVTAIAQATLAYLGFLFLGVPRSLLLAATTFFTSMVPFIGAASVWLGTAIFLGATGRWGAAAILAVYGTIVISGVDNFIKPFLIGRETRVHPLLVFISIFGGLQLFGFMGIFLGPVCAAFFLTILELYRQHYYPPARE